MIRGAFEAGGRSWQGRDEAMQPMCHAAASFSISARMAPPISAVPDFLMFGCMISVVRKPCASAPAIALSIRSASLTNPQEYPVSYTHLRAHETPEHLVCRLLLEKK